MLLMEWYKNKYFPKTAVAQSNQENVLSSFHHLVFSTSIWTERSYSNIPDSVKGLAIWST